MPAKKPFANYTDPALREKLKKKIESGDKGGRRGQWSARKAQLLAAEYKKAGGGYSGAKSESQKHLDTWTKEKWQTKDGDVRARHGDTTERYLPEKAWKDLSPEEKKKTNARKREGSKSGKQFVANTPAAKRARRDAST